MSDQTVTVDPNKNMVKDPSKGCGHLKIVTLSNPESHPDPGDITVTQPNSNITFEFSEGTADGFYFTGFRYLRIHHASDSNRFEYGGWAAPANDPHWNGEIGVRINYDDATHTGLKKHGKVRTLTITDTNNYDVVYLYLVEYMDPDKNIWVFDPKIRNQPGGDEDGHLGKKPKKNKGSTC